MKSARMLMWRQARHLVMVVLVLSQSLTLEPAHAQQGNVKLPAPEQIRRNSPSENVTIGRLLRKQHDFKACALLCEQAMPAASETDPQSYKLLTALQAFAYFQMHNEPQWRRSLDRYHAAHPHDPWALYVKVHYLLGTQSPESGAGSRLAESKRCLSLIRRDLLKPAEKASAMVLEGAIAYREHRFRDYMNLSKRAYEIDPTLSNCYVLASACSVAGDHKAAAQYYLKCSQLDKSRPELALAVVSELQLGGDHRAAVQQCYDVMKRFPNYQPCAVALAFCLINTKMSDQEARQLRQKLEAIDDSKCAKPDQFAKYKYLTGLASQLGDRNAACKYASKLAAIDPGVESLAGIANLYFDAKQYGQAAGWFRKMLVIEPNNVVGLTRLATCEARADHLDLAIRLLTQALTIAPRDVGALKLRGALYCVKGDMVKASAELEQLQKVCPDKQYSLETLRAWGLPYCKDLRKYMQDAASGWQVADEQALSRLTKDIAVESDKDKRARLLQSRARLNFAMGRFQQALPDLDQSIGLGNDSYRVHSLKAGVLFALKKWPEAKAERALTVALHDSQRGRQ